ncbi:MAG: matrixin family metalloprotease [Acidobacteria bacterium]|nr:matrixin family metalloprotease [Acidobacteriota bacterium]
MIRVRRIAAAFMGLVVLATSAFASYTVVPGRSEPQQLRWKDGMVRIAISKSLSEQTGAIKSGSDIAVAIRNSLLLWENAADIKFTIEATDARNVSPSGVAGDGVSLITIAASPENVLLFTKDPMAESARTRVFYNRRGFITEADIVLNPYQQFSTDGTAGTFDLEATLTHEIGHLLGLRHSSVLGAVMSEGIARNAGGVVASDRRIDLSDADVTAARELYGFVDDVSECCSSISGKITQAPSKTPPKALSVWAEDNTNGRVVAQAETSPDGTYRLGGLSAGLYTIFWQNLDRSNSTHLGDLGTVRLSDNEDRTVNGKVAGTSHDLALSFMGLDSQLADAAILIGNAREYTVYLGGRDFELNDLRIEFNSPYFRAIPGSIKRHDLGEKLSAVSFLLAVDEEVPSGVYSLFLTGNDGILAAMVGGLKVPVRPNL